MLGLIKKDFLLMKSNLKSMAIIFIVYLVMVFQGTLDITFIIPLVGVMTFISTFSYDDFNNWNAYAVALPNGRKNVVRAKYIASIIMTIILGVVSLIISVGIGYLQNNNINFTETMSSLIGTLFSCSIIISLLYPIILKFGATNGKIILFAVVFGILGIGTLLTKFIDTTYVLNIINKMDNYFPVVFLITSIIMLGISYLISNKIYQSKEF